MDDGTATGRHASGTEGLFLAVIPAPVMIACRALPAPLWIWPLMLAAMASLVTLGFLHRLPAHRHRPLISLAVILTIAVYQPWTISHPLMALITGTVCIAGAFAALAPRRRRTSTDQVAPDHRLRTLARTRPALGGSTLLTLAAIIGNGHMASRAALMASVVITTILLCDWGRAERCSTGQRAPTHLRLLTLLSLLAAGASLVITPALWLLLPLLLSLLVLLPGQDGDGMEGWWRLALEHPARLLVIFFLTLAVAGTLLLRLPIASVDSISRIDAAFTATSAACVTGLIVVDTPQAFTLFGQGLILLLIQLGGLGIMSISVFALHALGRRMSVRQEVVLKNMIDPHHGDVTGALGRILRVTIVAETLGATILTLRFLAAGDGLAMAAWRGLFTAVSAFCNAGFALQSDSLMTYGGDPWILHTVAALIILGGIAPATVLLLPHLLLRRPIPITARLTIIATGLLLVLGAGMMLALEWHHTLDGRPWSERLHHAWFQSATLRTAGFNSVDISAVTPPTYIIMLLFMFIGGSPGGTAGGIKVTAVVILALAMWSSITGHQDIHAGSRRIPPRLVNRAVAIAGSGLAVWFIVVLALALTQTLSTRDLIFEATSALATVGLTTGGTPQLDGLGKVIIIIAMFLGRVGPMTFLLLLSERPRISRLERLDINIPMT